MKITDFTIDGLEDFLEEALSSDDPKLELPSSFDTPLPFCSESFLWQLIVTMSRRFDDRFVVRLTGLRRDHELFEQMLKKALGHAHVIFALAMGRVEDENGVELDRTAPRGFNQYLEAMNRQDFLGTYAGYEQRANLICVQNERRNEVEYIRPLYERNAQGQWKVRPHGDIRLVVQGILVELNHEWPGSVLRSIGAPLAQLITELFENSDSWARSDETNRLYAKGVRAISFRILSVDTKDAAFFAGKNTRLQAYLSQRISKQTVKTIDFLELSVVDSGPGLARRWVGAKRKDGKRIPLDGLSQEEERDAVKACFGKWRTSAGTAMRGIGLFSAAKMVRKQDGFLRVRTGRESYLYGTDSLYNTVVSKAGRLPAPNTAEGDTLDDGTFVLYDTDGEIAFYLQPWQKTRMFPTYGTSFSVLLPIER